MKRKREFECIFKINVARILSSNFCHRKAIITNSADRPVRGRSTGYVLRRVGKTIMDLFLPLIIHTNFGSTLIT